MNSSPPRVPEKYQRDHGHNNESCPPLTPAKWAMGKGAPNPRFPASLVKLGRRQGQAISITRTGC